jgi:hypothetical protein
MPLYDQPVFADHRGFNSEFPWSANPNDHDYDLSLPNVEKIVGSMIGLPNHPGLETEDIEYVIETIRAFAPEDSSSMTNSSAGNQLPDVAVVTMRSGATPQNATYLLLNVLSELTTVSLVTVMLSEESDIHGKYDVTEIAHGAKADGLLGTILLFVRNQLRLCGAIRRFDAPVIYFFGGTAYSLPIVFAKLLGKTVVVQPRGDVPLTLQLEWEEQYPDIVARTLANSVRLLEFGSLWAADRIVTYTESMAEELKLGFKRSRIRTEGSTWHSMRSSRHKFPVASQSPLEFASGAFS